MEKNRDYIHYLTYLSSNSYRALIRLSLLANLSLLRAAVILLVIVLNGIKSASTVTPVKILI